MSNVRRYFPRYFYSDINTFPRANKRRIGHMAYSRDSPCTCTCSVVAAAPWRHSTSSHVHYSGTPTALPGQSLTFFPWHLFARGIFQSPSTPTRGVKSLWINKSVFVTSRSRVRWTKKQRMCRYIINYCRSTTSTECPRLMSTLNI